MFTREQRFIILKYGTTVLLTLSVLPIMTHGIFFVVLFQYYLPIAIILFALYYCYNRIKEIDITDKDLKNVFQSLFSLKK